MFGHPRPYSIENILQTRYQTDKGQAEVWMVGRNKKGWTCKQVTLHIFSMSACCMSIQQKSRLTGQVPVSHLFLFEC